ncbi:hypothetical protein K438DRAFT_1757383 [Mycena galopus ATCC 62051]|nr:hypothetical protein K438DRAFT_1757383 [Mycena galopus ATCC 62051]
MAPTFGTTFVLPPVGPFHPTGFLLPTPSATTSPTLSIIEAIGVDSSTPLSSPALDVVLVIAIVLALSGTGAIVWLCFRRRTPVPLASEPAPQPDSEKDLGSALKSPKNIAEAHITSTTLDSGQAFWVKRTMPIPGLINATQTRVNEALLSEVPNIWRILGRPNVAVEDSERDYGEAILDRGKTA